MFKRVFVIYLLGWLLIDICSFIVKKAGIAQFSFLLFVSSLLITYFIPQIIRILFRGKKYEGKHLNELWSFTNSLGIRLKDFFSIKSTGSNAYACGFGGNKIVVFHSTTLERHPYDELEGVVAHELGHYVNKDQVFYLVLVNIILLSTSYVNTTFFSSSTKSLLLISLLESTLLLPVVLLISQWRERLADKYAKKVLDDPEKFVRFFERMISEDERIGKKCSTNRNIFARFLRTHPLIHDRIKFLKS